MKVVEEDRRVLMASAIDGIRARPQISELVEVLCWRELKRSLCHLRDDEGIYLNRE